MFPRAKVYPFAVQRPALELFFMQPVLLMAVAAAYAVTPVEGDWSARLPRVSACLAFAARPLVDKGLQRGQWQGPRGRFRTVRVGNLGRTPPAWSRPGAGETSAGLRMQGSNRVRFAVTCSVIFVRARALALSFFPLALAHVERVALISQLLQLLLVGRFAGACRRVLGIAPGCRPHVACRECIRCTLSLAPDMSQKSRSFS